MESLVLMVAIIFFVMIVSGPIALLLSWLRLPWLAKSMAVLAFISGLHWITVVIFPANLMGLLGIICAFSVFYNKPKENENDW